MSFNLAEQLAGLGALLDSRTFEDPFGLGFKVRIWRVGAEREALDTTWEEWLKESASSSQFIEDHLRRQAKIERRAAALSRGLRRSTGSGAAVKHELEIYDKAIDGVPIDVSGLSGMEIEDFKPGIALLLFDQVEALDGGAFLMPDDNGPYQDTPAFRERLLVNIKDGAGNAYYIPEDHGKWGGQSFGDAVASWIYDTAHESEEFRTQAVAAAVGVLRPTPAGSTASGADSKPANDATSKAG